jgi:hypothetical protein
MRAFLVFLLLTGFALGQATDSNARVTALIKSITPKEPIRTGRGFEYLRYDSRMRDDRYAAMVELSNIGPDATAAVPLLTQLINDKYEPPHCKLAMVEALEKIGPASQSAIPALKKLKSSKNDDSPRADKKAVLISIAAERAILVIENKPEERKIRQLMISIYPLLEQFSTEVNPQTVRLIHDYYLQRDSKTSEYFAQRFKDVVTDSELRKGLVLQLLRDPIGNDLGRTLLNSSFIDGDATVKQLIVHSQRQDQGLMCLEYLDNYLLIAFHILDYTTIDDERWEKVLKTCKTRFLMDPSSSKHEKYSELNHWLRETSYSLGRRSDLARDWLLDPNFVQLQYEDQQDGMRQVTLWIRDVKFLNQTQRQRAFEWLVNAWEKSQGLDSLRLELTKSLKRLVESNTQGDRLFSPHEREGNVTARIQFLSQLIPEFRGSPGNKDEIVQQLVSWINSPNYVPGDVENLLMTLFRLQPFIGPMPPTPLAEQFLIDGRFAEGESTLQQSLIAIPEDDETRLGLGILQIAIAVENFGKKLYLYGAASENASLPFLRLPIPINKSPLEISYQEFAVILDELKKDLGKAEATLARVREDDVKLPLRLAEISFDFSGTGQNRASLLEVVSRLNGQRPLFMIANPEFRVHFDRGDVPWLRAYCHLISASIDCYQAIATEAVFMQHIAGIFSKVKQSEEYARLAQNGDSVWMNLEVEDASRFKSMRLHILSVCELNTETWVHIRKEEDDEYECLPHTLQTDLFLPQLRSEQVDGWLALMRQLEGLLRGDLLIPVSQIRLITPVPLVEDRGLNMQKWLDDPPAFVIRNGKLFGAHLEDRHLEPLNDKIAVDIGVMFALFQQFQNPFGIYQVVRLN